MRARALAVGVMARVMFAFLVLSMLCLGCCASQVYKLGIGAIPRPVPSISRVTAAAAMACLHANNKNSSLVPEFAQLKPDFVLECDIQWMTSAQDAVLRAIEWDEQGIVGIVGPHSSTFSVPVAVVAATSDTPVVSYMAVAPDLTEQPNFGRTVPILDTAAIAAMQLFKSFGWESIAIIYWVSDSFAAQAQSIAHAAGQCGITVLTAQGYQFGDEGELLESTMGAALESIASSGARIIIDGSSFTHIETIAQHVHRLGLAGRGYQWVNFRPPSGLWLATSNNYADPHAVYEFLRGTMSVGFPSFGGPSHEEAFQAVWRTQNQTALFALLPPQIEPFDLFAGEDWECSYACGNIYDAVAAYVVAIDKARDMQTSTHREFKQAVWEAMRATDMQASSGRLRFDETMNRDMSGMQLDVTMRVGLGVEQLALEAVSVATMALGGGVQRLPVDFEWHSLERGWDSIMADATTCRTGVEFSVSTLRCVTCPAGSAKSESDPACTPCPLGSVAPAPGMASYSSSPCPPCGHECIPCGDSGYADEGGLSECRRCPDNHHIRHDLGPNMSVSVDDCVCSRAYTMGCRFAVWQVVAVCVALLLVLLGCGSLVLCFARESVDAETKMVRARMQELRRRLFVRQQHGFHLDGEWVWTRMSVHIKSRLLEQLARLTLLLDFEVKKVDALTAILLYLGQDEVEEDDSRFSRSMSIDARTKQYISLRHLLLETTRGLLSPQLEDSETSRSSKTLQWAWAPSAADRFEFFKDKFSKLGFWEDEGNFALLKGVVQVHMDKLRESFDLQFARMREEEGFSDLLSLEAPDPEYAEMARQDHPFVEALPRIKGLNREIQALRMDGAASPLRRPRSSAFGSPYSPLIAAAPPKSPISRRRASWTPHSAGPAVAPPLLPPPLVASASPVGELVLADVSLQIEPDTPSPQTESQTTTVRDGEVLRRSVEKWVSNGSNTPTRTSSPSGVVATWRRASAGRRESSGRARRASRDWGQRRVDAQLVEEYEQLHAGLRLASKDAPSLSEEEEVEAAMERPFVHWLLNRAYALDKGFQAKVRSLLLEQGGPGTVVVPGPVKTEERMLAKLALYHQKPHANPQGLLPLSAMILDPIRASVVCNSSREVVDCARWLIRNGAAHDLPVVKQKNKFAMDDATEYDGYRDVNLCVLYTGKLGLKIIGEIQIHEERMHALKTKMHRLYKVKRATSNRNI